MKVRHYTTAAGLEAIRSSSTIRASDPDRGVSDGGEKYPGRIWWEGRLGERWGGRVYRALYAMADGGVRGVWVVPVDRWLPLRRSRLASGLRHSGEAYVEFDLHPEERVSHGGSVKWLFRQCILRGGDVNLGGRNPSYVRQGRTAE